MKILSVKDLEKISKKSSRKLYLPEALKVAACDEIMDDTEKLFGYNVVTFE